MNSTMNIFERGTRKKLRFPYKGSCSIEQLWDLSQEELDSVFKTLRSSKTENGLMDSGISAENEEIDLKMEIVKEIFRVKKEESDNRKAEMMKEQKRQEILAAIQAKDSEELRGMSREELEKKLMEL